VLTLEYKVESELLGRLWYIYPPSLHKYLREESITHWREAMEHEEKQKSDQ